MGRTPGVQGVPGRPLAGMVPDWLEVPRSGTDGVRMNRSVTGLVAAKAVSDVGFALDFVCLSVFVWIATQSVLATGAVSVALYGGGIVGGQLGHRYGAYWDRRRVMVAADLARMAALVLLAVAPAGVQLLLLYPAVVVIGSGRSVFDATLSAATPVLAGPRVQLFNSVLSGVKGVALMAGMGLSAVAVPLVGFRGVFFLDALTYGLSAAAVLLLPLRLRVSPPASWPGRRCSASASPCCSPSAAWTHWAARRSTSGCRSSASCATRPTRPASPARCGWRGRSARWPAASCCARCCGSPSTGYLRRCSSPRPW